MDLQVHAVRSRSNLRSRARWIKHARPIDYIVAMGDAYTSIPLSDDAWNPSARLFLNEIHQWRNVDGSTGYARGHVR